MQEVESFVFYRSYREALECLSPREQLETLLAICDYALYGTMPELSGVAHAIFTMARPTIDANRKRRESGKRGGRPKKGGSQEKNHCFSGAESTETEAGAGNGDEEGTETPL